MSDSRSFNMQCPIPLTEYPHILLAHGGGGRLMHQLIDNIFAASFAGSQQETNHDGAVVSMPGSRLAFTTDSYVVHPLFFPGGDIGSLAVYGTVNDLAMCGARPLYLSAAFILEEGFSLESLWAIAQSMRRAADMAGVSIITGDTKVVDRGRGDGVFITTSGVGEIGRHGMAVMAAREGLAFESTIESDCAPLAGPIMKLLENGIEVHCLRDLTRGGLATSLVEIGQASGMHIVIDDSLIPVREDVRGACEILGFDPMYVANEGRFVAFVPEKQSEAAIKIIRSASPDHGPVKIGQVKTHDRGLVTAKSIIGAERIIDMLSGEQLPRIC
jgi:hydrogenase expression/formation protein HypE